MVDTFIILINNVLILLCFRYFVDKIQTTFFKLEKWWNTHHGDSENFESINFAAGLRA